MDYSRSGIVTRNNLYFKNSKPIKIGEYYFASFKDAVKYCNKSSPTIAKYVRQGLINGEVASLVSKEDYKKFKHLRPPKVDR